LGNKQGVEGDKGKQRETRRKTRPSEGGHTIQHQSGHLKKALRIPNNTLFREIFQPKLKIIFQI
jgi:hypothetical protein